MTNACDRADRWLRDADRPDAPPPDLDSHSHACETCGPVLEMERRFRDRLGAGAAMDPARREALVSRVLGARPAEGRQRGRVLRWAWLVPAAAAAALLLLAVLPGRGGPPIHPTDVFADLLGPLVVLMPAEPAAPTPTPPEEPSASDLVYAAIWGDLAAPLDITRTALKAPLAMAPATRVLPAPQDPVATDGKGAVQ